MLSPYRYPILLLTKVTQLSATTAAPTTFYWPLASIYDDDDDDDEHGLACTYYDIVLRPPHANSPT